MASSPCKLHLCLLTHRISATTTCFIMSQTLEFSRLSLPLSAFGLICVRSIVQLCLSFASLCDSSLVLSCLYASSL